MGHSASSETVAQQPAQHNTGESDTRGSSAEQVVLVNVLTGLGEGVKTTRAGRFVSLCRKQPTGRIQYIFKSVRAGVLKPEKKWKVGRHRQVKKNACRWNVVIVKRTTHTNYSVSAHSAPSPCTSSSEKQDLRGTKAPTDTSPPLLLLSMWICLSFCYLTLRLLGV